MNDFSVNKVQNKKISASILKQQYPEASLIVAPIKTWLFTKVIPW